MKVSYKASEYTKEQFIDILSRLKKEIKSCNYDKSNFLIAKARIVEFKSRITKIDNSNLESTKSELTTSRMSITKGGNHYTNV